MDAERGQFSTLIDTQTRKTKRKGVIATRLKPLYLLVPGARIELAQPYDRGILSPLRLPVPPSGHLFWNELF